MTSSSSSNLPLHPINDSGNLVIPLFCKEPLKEGDPSSFFFCDRTLSSSSSRTNNNSNKQSLSHKEDQEFQHQQDFLSVEYLIQYIFFLPPSERIQGVLRARYGKTLVQCRDVVISRKPMRVARLLLCNGIPCCCFPCDIDGQATLTAAATTTVIPTSSSQQHHHHHHHQNNNMLHSEKYHPGTKYNRTHCDDPYEDEEYMEDDDDEDRFENNHINDHEENIIVMSPSVPFSYGGLKDMLLSFTLPPNHPHYHGLCAPLFGKNRNSTVFSLPSLKDQYYQSWIQRNPNEIHFVSRFLGRNEAEIIFPRKPTGSYRLDDQSIEMLTTRKNDSKGLFWSDVRTRFLDEGYRMNGIPVEGLISNVVSASCCFVPLNKKNEFDPSTENDQYPFVDISLSDSHEEDDDHGNSMIVGDDGTLSDLDDDDDDDKKENENGGDHIACEFNYHIRIGGRKFIRGAVQMDRQMKMCNANAITEYLFTESFKHQHSDKGSNNTMMYFGTTTTSYENMYIFAFAYRPTISLKERILSKASSTAKFHSKRGNYRLGSVDTFQVGFFLFREISPRPRAYDPPHQQPEQENFFGNLKRASFYARERALFDHKKDPSRVFTGAYRKAHMKAYMYILKSICDQYECEFTETLGKSNDLTGEVIPLIDTERNIFPQFLTHSFRKFFHHETTAVNLDSGQEISIPGELLNLEGVMFSPSSRGTIEMDGDFFPSWFRRDKSSCKPFWCF